MKYYRLVDDINFKNRWYLGDIQGINNNWDLLYPDFAKKTKKNQKTLNLELLKPGQNMDYTTTEAYNIPIISERIKYELRHIDKVNFFSVKLINFKIYILHTELNIDCVDELNSEFSKFVENDPIRPDLVGHYSWISKLKIDYSKVSNMDIFRINKAENYLIVSQLVKDVFDCVSATGSKFIEV